ncbi:conjugative transposon protein TraN [Mucilaginibacter sp. dw_454]|uniref:conjugative transposon protein TraN n=1 Tax=Mucilaginibacter sp. dw_454 TaxID=2720079 RepID=UPI001BD2954B|nr:conjugative transposon protein TraN [Mucilaginibacter sp. dw_454]
MKKAFLLFGLLMLALGSYAQSNLASGVHMADLPIVYLPANSTIHFISPENIQYVDISAKNLVGDLPVKNIVRLKYKTDTLQSSSDAVVTIAGEKFLAQYRVVYSPPNGGAIESNIEIVPADMRLLDFPGISLSQKELRGYAVDVFAQKPERHLEQSKAYGIKAQLYHIYTLGDYVFLDLGYENGSKLAYDIDELRFKVDDKKITKASTVQSLEIKPELALFDVAGFKKRYRNVFVFKKFTFPGNKLLHIELSEKQLSGRIITLSIPYKDVLDADVIEPTSTINRLCHWRRFMGMVLLVLA